MAELWRCPWRICTHSQAQECRKVMRPRAGCGGRFPGSMTPDEAEREVRGLKLTAAEIEYASWFPAAPSQPEGGV